jgi:nucleoside-diphosphate-sugar epimerase
MPNILITGGAGFIGGHLAQVLTNYEAPCHIDNHVHIVDNLSSAPLPVDVLLSDCGYPPNLTVDIEDLHTWITQHPEPKWDVIYHLAAPVGPAGILPHAGKMAYYILRDTMAICDLARRSGARLVDVSTSEVYGGGQQGLCAEDMPRLIQAKTTARLEYATGKLAAETALINQCRTTDLDAVIVRPFNVTGARQSGKGGFVLPRLVAQAMTGLPLTIFGDGSQVRAFTHVLDIVDGLIRAAELGQSGEVYNIGNPANKTTILDLAHQVLETVGHGELTFMDGRDVYGPLYAEAADKYPDASKAMRDLDWHPTRDIRVTVAAVHSYMVWSELPMFERLAGFPVKEHPVWMR